MSDEFDEVDNSFDEENDRQGLKFETVPHIFGSRLSKRRVEPAWRRIEILREQRDLERLLNYD